MEGRDFLDTKWKVIEDRRSALCKKENRIFFITAIFSKSKAATATKVASAPCDYPQTWSLCTEETKGHKNELDPETPQPVTLLEVIVL